MFKDNFTVKITLEGYSILNRKRSILLNFEEASVRETLEFLEKVDKANFEIIEFIYKFFEKASNWKLNKKVFSKYIANNLSLILQILKKTYIKGVFWEEKKVIKEKEGEEPENLDQEDFKKDFGRLIAFLTTRMAIDPNGILEKYTWRQITFWTKHYLYNERQKTEEGQKENKKIENKEYTDKYEKEIKETLGRLDRYLQAKS